MKIGMKNRIARSDAPQATAQLKIRNALKQ
jgi:hypothetical protein